MGCRILGNDVASFYCSTTMIAFGPVTTKDELEEFSAFLGKDPREVGDIMKEWNIFQELQDE